MPVLIVESNAERGALWRTHIDATGMETILVHGQTDAVTVLQTRAVGLIVMNLDLGGGSALAVTDFASYRRPEAKVILLTGSGLFSDGSIFQHAANVCAYLPTSTRPEDLAAMVEHYRCPG